MPPKTHRISIADKELHIDGIKKTNSIGGVSAFKLGPDKVSGLTFDEKFWKQCFTGDSVKDGTSKSIQQGFLKEENGWTDDVMFSGDQIKKLSSQMVDRLYGVNMIFMAELLRFKGYKDSSNVPEELKTQFASAFPERLVYVNKDSGLDTDIILGVEKSKKCCNVATDIIDPHSSSVKDCDIRFPAINDSIVLDKSVFEYLQYPSETSLTSKTLAEKGKYESNFVVDGADLMSNEGFYFAGNKKKNAAMKEGGAKAIEDKAIEATESKPKQSESKQSESKPKQSDTKQSDKKQDDKKLEAMKLCVAKYSGDTLQSMEHRLFELIDNRDDCAYTISTCDSIVSLRSYALNGSFIEVYTEKENKDKKKVTKIYVWRQDLSSPQKLMEIFLKEKERIILEYDTFIKIIRDIKYHYEDGKNTANNIVIMGSGTTYRLNTGFYDDLIVDLSTIVGLLTRFGPPRDPDANMLGQFIREIRTYKVNDFFKINGKGGKNYFMTMATKYTKGDLTRFPEATWVLNKRPSETFFDCARTKYKDGGSNAKVMRGESLKQSSIMYDSNYYIKTYFDFDYYKKNPCIFIEDNDDDNLISYDLHKEFTKDFAEVFNRTSKEFLKKTKQEYDTVFIECFCDVINSFAILDIDPRKNHQGYYHPESIAKLCNHYYRYEDIRREKEALALALALEKAKEALALEKAKEALALEKAKEVLALEKAKEALALEKAKEVLALEKAKEVRAKEVLALEKAKMAEQFRQLEESMPMEEYIPSKADRKMAEQRRKLEETMQTDEVRRVRKPKIKHTSYKSRKPNASQIAELILKKNPDIISVYNSLSLEEKRAAFKSLGIGQIAIGRSKKSTTEKQILKELMRRERTGSFGGAKTRKNRK
jgi:hypothetical protein